MMIFMLTMMEEEGIGARSPISCYSTIRFVIITMVIMTMMMFMLMMMEEEGMGAWSLIYLATPQLGWSSSG